MTDEEIGDLYESAHKREPFGYVDWLQFGRAVAAATRAEAMEEAAKTIVNSSIDDYGSLSYCADLIRALAQQPGKEPAP